MINIFADTHQIIASNIYENIDDIYNIKLDNSALAWGSVAPDILPKYKKIRHYKKESLEFVVNEIVKLIYLNRNLDFNRIDPITMKFFSKNLGIISHYLSDFVCLPHAKRWTFSTNMFKHIKYEYRLDNKSVNHEFNKYIINGNKIDIYKNESVKMIDIVRDFILNVVEEYSTNNESYENDLDFALALNLELSSFVIESIQSYSKNVYEGLVFEF